MNTFWDIDGNKYLVIFDPSHPNSWCGSSVSKEQESEYHETIETQVK